MDESVALALVPALLPLREDLILRLERVNDATIPACLAFLGADFRCWLEGRPQTLLRLLVRGCAAPIGVTLNIEPFEALDTARALAEALFDAGVLVDLRLPAGTALSNEATARLAEDLCATGVLPGNDSTSMGEDVRPVLSIELDGRASRCVEDAPLVSHRIQEVGLERALAELALGPRALDGQAIYWPQTLQIPLSRGRFRRSYGGGGSMALGCFFTQAEARAALGFDDDAEFRQWVEEVVDNPDLAEAFPTFPGMVETPGVFGVGAVPSVKRPRWEPRLVLILASWLAQGDRENARSMLGLQRGHFDTDDKRDLTALEDIELGKFVDSACRLLAKSVILLVKSKIEWEGRHRAALALRLLGSPRAREAARVIAAFDESIGNPIAKRMRNRMARARLDQADNPRAALRFLEETVDAVCANFSRGGAR